VKKQPKKRKRPTATKRTQKTGETMNLDDLTIKQARELSAMFGGGSARRSHSLEVGKSYFFRTITYHYVGKIESITDSDIKFSESCWIGWPEYNAGFQHDQMLKTGKLSDVGPLPAGTIIRLDGIIEIAPWAHEIPKERK